MKLLELVCKELGVEVGKDWVGNDGYKYRISKNGEIFLYDKRGFYTGSRGFGRWESVFNGELKPVWKPRVGEEFYIIDLINEDLYDVTFWSDSEINHKWLERGLVFKTKEEAIKAANKMLNSLKEED